MQFQKAISYGFLNWNL